MTNTNTNANIGTYVEFPLLKRSSDRVRDYVAEDLQLPRPTHNLHVTTVYSRVPIEYRPVSGSGSFVAYPSGFVIFNSPSYGVCLCLSVRGSFFYESWNSAIKSGATWDHPSFIPHLTLAYGLTVADLHSKILHPPSFRLFFGREVVKELDLDWRPS